MALHYGVIAEDVSDVNVIKLLAKKIVGSSISTSHFVGKGCGAIRRKALGWCKAFQLKGCQRILLVHDRDDANEAALRRDLEAILAQAPQPYKVVVIPVEELEAWLLSDHTAIARALNLRRELREEHHPEEIGSPKEHLERIIFKASEKRTQYVNSIHNALIADQIDVTKIKAKCPSFARFSEFLEQHRPAAKKRAKRGRRR